MKVFLVDDSRLGVVMVNRSHPASTFTRQDVEKQLGRKLLSMFEPVPEICFHASKTSTPMMLGQPDAAAAVQVRELEEILMRE